MLFDPRPKNCRDSLFDREREVDELKGSISRVPITLLLGIRRIGKTSVLKVALNELESPYIYLDLRILEEEGYSRASLYRFLSEAFSNAASRWSKLVHYLRGVKGVEVYGFRINFEWREESLTLIRILDKLNKFGEDEGGFVVLAFDEAQFLRNLSGGKGRMNFGNILAYAYDNLSNLRFVLTGSEVGLLLNMLKLDDASSPLYGRYVKIVKLEKFDRERSLEFLKKGFEEVNIRVSEEILHEICGRVDGIVGWLTYFGYSIVESRNPSMEIVNETAEKALKLVQEEMDKVFKRSKYYLYVLKAISLGMNTWSGIKRAVEVWVNRPLQNAQITRFLETLIDLSIVEKRDDYYMISDPLIAEYSKRL
ncbi:MAG: ATP-binding protein [archaeon YNP-WB-062]|jgi:AAA+ ATPase superfamily predicted ATPase|nr:ATP-binding protein [Candidatus Culexarchaeum yellowstonense]